MVMMFYLARDILSKTLGLLTADVHDGMITFDLHEFMCMEVKTCGRAFLRWSSVKA